MIGERQPHMTMSTPAPKRGPGAPRKERPKVHLTIRVDPDKLALAQHLFAAKQAGRAIDKALDWAIADAGRWLTPEIRERILAAARVASASS